MGLFGRLTTLAKSQQGRKVIAQAQKAARDPQNRERLDKVRSRIQNRGGAAPKGGTAEPHSSGTGTQQAARSAEAPGEARDA